MSGSTANWSEAPVLKLVLEQDHNAPSAARAAICAFCDSRGIGEPTVSTLTLLVSEVVTNAVKHSRVPGPANIQLVGRIDRNSVRVEVTDDGGGFVPAPRDPSKLGSGYGLYLLDTQASRWGIDTTTGTCVWFEVAL